MVISNLRRRPANVLLLVTGFVAFLFFVQVSRSRIHRGSQEETSPKPPSHSHTPRRNALVVASLKNDDVTWLERILPDWEKNVYVANDPNATLTVPRNKGRESMIYLR